VVSGERDLSRNLTGGRPLTETTHAFEGIVEQGSQARVGDTLAKSGGRFVLILGGSVDVVPQVGDRASIDGRDYTLLELVERDPAGATYRFRVEV
jgi:hypothetical protein